MERGGQPGNQNAARGRIWRDAILRALAKRSKKDQVDALDDLAEKLLAAAEGGDLPALRELGDRLEGKAVQQTEVSGANGADLVLKVMPADADA